MRKVTLLAFSLIVLCCSKKQEVCTNHFDFLNCNEQIPIFEVDYSMDFDSSRLDLQSKFETDLCDVCSYVYFKIPFDIDNKPGFIKIMSDFDYPVCENCPISMRLRSYYDILINHNSELLVEGKLMHIDSLRYSIINYFNNVGKSETQFPKEFNQVLFRLSWDRKTKRADIDKVLGILQKAYLDFVINRVEIEGRNFCDLTKLEVEDVKQKYPLKIEFDLGKIHLMKPNFDNLIYQDTVKVDIEADLKSEL